MDRERQTPRHDGGRGPIPGVSMRDSWTDSAEGPDRRKLRKDKRKSSKATAKAARVNENARRAAENKKRTEEVQRAPPRHTVAAPALKKTANVKIQESKQRNVAETPRMAKPKPSREQRPQPPPQEPIEEAAAEHDEPTTGRQQKRPAKRPRVAIPLDILGGLGQPANKVATMTSSFASTVTKVPTASAELQTQVQRICNKLTVQNIGTLTKSLMDLFEIGGHPRGEVVDAFCLAMDEGLLQHTALTSAIALAYSGVIRALQLRHGNATASRAFEFIAQTAAGAIQSGNQVVASNCAMTVAHLLLVHACDHALVTSFIRHCVGTASVASLQAAMFAVRAAGDRLRVDCPSELNSLVEEAAAALARHQSNPAPEVPLVRLSVFIDILKSIASGKSKTSANTGAVGEVDRSGLTAVSEALVEFVTSFESAKMVASNKRLLAKSVASAHVLQCDFQQCAAPAKPPQWWTQMASKAHDDLELDRAFTKHRTESYNEEEQYDDNGAYDEDADAQYDGEEGHYNEEGAAAEDAPATAVEQRRKAVKEMRALESAVSGQRLSTELRRNIFNAIAQSHDDADCFHRLMALGGSTGTHLIDIATVLLQCAVQDRAVNVFYSRVLQRLVSAQKKFRMVLQFALWDRFKGVMQNDVDICGYINLAAVIAFLVQESLLNLSVLRGLDIDQGLGKNVNLFLRILLLRLLLELDAKKIADFFFGVDASKRVADTTDVNAVTSTSKAAMRKALLKFFVHTFADEEAAGLWMPPLFDVVAKDLDLTPADVERLPTKIAVAKRALRDGV
jgi:nucleolar MIF4G domain-containing protein 1